MIPLCKEDSQGIVSLATDSKLRITRDKRNVACDSCFWLFYGLVSYVLFFFFLKRKSICSDVETRKEIETKINQVENNILSIQYFTIYSL